MSIHEEVNRESSLYQDLNSAIEFGQDSHLYTVGEYQIIKNFYRLPKNSRAFYTKLISRKGKILRLEPTIHVETLRIANSNPLFPFLKTIHPTDFEQYLSHSQKTAIRKTRNQAQIAIFAYPQKY